jgi:catechol 2,3-dioxygenase-like lactoylglutathione lyase family enzyme
MKPLFAVAFALTILLPLQAQLTPPNEAGITTGHVHLNVKDVDVQKKFWIEQFGAVPLTGEKPQLPGVKVPGMLILFYKKDAVHGTEGSALDNFGFKVHSLPEMEKSLRAGGYEVGKDFKGTEGFQNTYVTGPDNLKIELQEDVTLPVRAAVNHLHYVITDAMALRNWYVEKLGLTATERGAFKTANAGAVNLTFQAARTPPTIPGTKGGTIDHIGFEVKDLEAYCKKLEANGIKLDMPYRKIPSLGIAIAFLTDPQGVYIELTEGLGIY